MLVLARPDIIEVILIVHFSPASRDENSTFARRTCWLCMRMPHIVEIVHIDENMTLCCLILFLALTKQKSWNGKGFFRFVQHTVEPVAIRLCHPPPPYLSPYFNLLTNKWTVSKSRQKDKSHSRDSRVYDWGMANGHEKNLADTFGLLYLLKWSIPRRVSFAYALKKLEERKL